MANWRWYIQRKKMEEQRKICTTVPAHILLKQYYGVRQDIQMFSAEQRLPQIEI